MKYAPAARTTVSASIRSPAAVTHPLRARPVHGQSVDQGVGEDGEVRPAPRRVEVREPRVPAGPLDDVRGERGPADGLRRVVRVVEEREAELTGRLEERDMERRRLVRVRRPDAERLAGLGEVRRQGRVAPVGPPFVVVLGCADHRHAGVVRGAAADHPRTERPFVLAARPPVVREGERPRVEQVVGPRPGRPGAVVGARFDQADPPCRILGEARRHDAPCGAATDDRDVEAHGASIRRLIERGLACSV